MRMMRPNPDLRGGPLPFPPAFSRWAHRMPTEAAPMISVRVVSLAQGVSGAQTVALTKGTRGRRCRVPPTHKYTHTHTHTHTPPDSATTAGALCPKEEAPSVDPLSVDADRLVAAQLMAITEEGGRGGGGAATAAAVAVEVERDSSAGVSQEDAPEHYDGGRRCRSCRYPLIKGSQGLAEGLSGVFCLRHRSGAKLVCCRLLLKDGVCIGDPEGQLYMPTTPDGVIVAGRERFVCHVCSGATVKICTFAWRRACKEGQSAACTESISRRELVRHLMSAQHQRARDGTATPIPIPSSIPTSTASKPRPPRARNTETHAHTRESQSTPATRGLKKRRRDVSPQTSDALTTPSSLAGLGRPHEYPTPPITATATATYTSSVLDLPLIEISTLPPPPKDRNSFATSMRLLTDLYEVGLLDWELVYILMECVLRGKSLGMGLMVLLGQGLISMTRYATIRSLVAHEMILWS